MSRIGRDDAARRAEEARRRAEEVRRRAEELARARAHAPAAPPPVVDPARAARPAPEDRLERAPRLFGREIPLDGPVPPPRIEVPVPDATSPNTPPADIRPGPRTDVLPRLSAPTTPRARLDADFDRQQLREALGPVSVASGLTAVGSGSVVGTARSLVAVKKLDWDKVAPGLLGSKLRAIAEKAGSLEARATQIKEALSAVETRHAPTLVGVKMAGGFLEKAAFKAGVARELSKLVPGEAEGSLQRMAAARQELVGVGLNAGEAAATLRDLAPNAAETPWALREIREIERTAGSAQWELSQTESRGQMLAAMDAGAGLLTEAPSEAPPPAAAPAEATAPAPGAEFEFGQEDLDRIGTGLDPNKPPAQTHWSEQMVNTVCELGRQQGGVTDEQGGRNFELAKVVLGSAEGGTGAKPLEAGDLAAVLKMAGVDLTKVDANQLRSAAKYVSGASSLEDQQQKLRKAIENFQVLEKIGLPKLSRQQMADQLWGVAKVPSDALKKLSDSELQKKFQEVLGALNAGPGKSEIKIGKHKLTLVVGENGDVKKATCKKPGFFSKVWSAVKVVTPIALTVMSFIPVTAPFARAAQGVISLVQAIKAKSVLGIATAGASLLGIGSKVAQAASRALQGVSQIKSGNWVGGLASIGSVVGSGLKGLSGSIGRIADKLDQVSTKASAVGAGVASFDAYKKASQAVKDAKEALQAAEAKGDARAIAAAEKKLSQAETEKRAAAIGGAAGAATAASALVGGRSLFRGQSKSERPAQTALERNLQYASRALGVAQGVAGKDYKGAAVSAFSLGATAASAKNGGAENRWNDAANMAQAGLAYYETEKGRKAANQAVSDAQARLDAAKRNGNPEVIRQAETDLKKAKGAAESALMGGMAAGESLLATARDVGDRNRWAKSAEAGKKTKDRLADVVNDPDAPVPLREGALAEHQKLRKADEELKEEVNAAGGDPEKLKAAREKYDKVRQAAESRLTDLTSGAATGSRAEGTSSAVSPEAGGSPGQASLPRPRRIAAANVTKGLTVWEVSQRTGVPVERILEFNAQSGNPLDPKNLQIGQQIIVPMDPEDIKFQPRTAEQVQEMKERALAEKNKAVTASPEPETKPAASAAGGSTIGPRLGSPSELFDLRNKSYDGALIGSLGDYPPGTPLSEIQGVQDEQGAKARHRVIFVNGIHNGVRDHYESLERIAGSSGAEVVGIYNASEGIPSDLFQCVLDKVDLGKNPAVETLRNTLLSELRDPKAGTEPIYLMAHSQGGIITSRALEDVKFALVADGLSPKQAEQRLGRIRADTFGGAAWNYPDGPRYRHYLNEADPISRLAGLDLGYIPGFRPFFGLTGGKGAEFIHIRSTDRTLHSFGRVYLPNWTPPWESVGK